ncbi:MAG: VWA domain-containing protein [Candidatus Nitrosocosmicus sp.]
MRNSNSRVLLVLLILSFNFLVGSLIISPLKLSYSQNGVTGFSCGPIDLVIAVDNTNSMRGAINSIKFELSSMIDLAENKSSSDLRLGYLNFKDKIVVQNSLSSNLTAVINNIKSTIVSYGGELPEASDEAKNTAVNNLGPRENQTGDFSEPWRENATKILILITDAPPGGFNDVTDQEDVDRMHQVALTAQSKGIRVSDVFVPTEGDYAGQAAILQDDALTSGGIFTTTLEDGTGTADAIKEIISKCGEGQLPEPSLSSCSDENTQHWDKIVFKIKNAELAKALELSPNTELDIKVMDEPSQVIDLKQKVFDFFGLHGQDASSDYIEIVDVEYATICIDKSVIKERSSTEMT